MQMTEARTSWARICMAGCVADAERICRAHCFSVGLCVTLSPCEYVYSGGQESGFVVGLINYPRFPSTPDEICAKAEVLANLLCEGLAQRSFTIETPTTTRWFTQALPFELRGHGDSTDSGVNAGAAEGTPASHGADHSETEIPRSISAMGSTKENS